jgi:hypothetical protein
LLRNSASEENDRSPKNRATRICAAYIQAMKINNVTNAIQPSSSPAWEAIVPMTVGQLRGAPASRNRLMA